MSLENIRKNEQRLLRKAERYLKLCNKMIQQSNVSKDAKLKAQNEILACVCQVQISARLRKWDTQNASKQN